MSRRPTDNGPSPLHDAILRGLPSLAAELEKEALERERITRERLEADAELVKQTTGDPSFMSWVFVQTSLPHSKPDGNAWTRRNGDLELHIVGNPTYGLPYGRYPRLLLCWLTTEVKRTGSRCLDLGHNCASFMAQLGLHRTAGRTGTIFPLRLQMCRLFASTISVTGDLPELGFTGDEGFRVTDRFGILWDKTDPTSLPKWGSGLVLSEGGYETFARKAVAVDMPTLKALRSPLAIDIYVWLTYRMNHVKNDENPIPWEALAFQFGSEYGRLCDFKKRFLKRLREVLRYYPHARVRRVGTGLRLLPSPTHVPKIGV